MSDSAAPAPATAPSPEATPSSETTPPSEATLPFETTPPSETSPPVVIRPLVVTDCDQLVDTLYVINEFEGKDMTLPQLTAADLAREGFGPRPGFSCIVADCGGRLVGHAIYTTSWAGYDGIGRCLYMTDLFVREEMRRRGVGRRMLQAVAAAAVREGAPHIDFNVYGWNEPAVRFYRGFGCRSATEEDNMLCYFCDQTAVHRLAEAHEEEGGAAEEAPIE